MTSKKDSESMRVIRKILETVKSSNILKVLIILVVIIMLIIIIKINPPPTPPTPPVFYPIDKLFTVFAYVPLIDYRRDFLMFGGDDPVIVGYCYRQYEVGIGYDNVTDLLSEHWQDVCSDNIMNLPQPKILSTNPVSSKSVSGYTAQECDSWDLDSEGTRRSQAYIFLQLKKDGQWEKIVKNSQEILRSFIKIYCE